MSDAKQIEEPTDCAVIEELLPGYADDELNPAARETVHHHVESCERCGMLAEEYARGIGVGSAVWDGDSDEAADEADVADITGMTTGITTGVTSRVAVAAVPTDTPRWRRAPTLVVGGLIGLGLLGGAAGATFFAGDPAGGAVVASLTGVGDDEVRSAGFTLRRPARLQVHAIGEGSGGQMYDYAWIVDANTRQPVWSMKYRDTHHAGGASKNRMFHEELALESGNYIVYYATDGSHSSDSWNSTPPTDREGWGVAILTADGTRRGTVKPYDPSSDPNVVAQIIGARDDQHLTQEFSLSRDTDVRVYAIGEGDSNEMYDYAWIQNADRRVVWEMQYRQTEHAGGAQKNRMVNGTVSLPRGSYTLHYRTDDSHSFNDWNSTAPTDQMSYGVTLYRAGR